MVIMHTLKSRFSRPALSGLVLIASQLMAPFADAQTIPARPRLAADVIQDTLTVIYVDEDLPLFFRAPPAAPQDPKKDASRLMRQATFGANRDVINAVASQGPAAWIEAEFAKPITSHLTTVKADPRLVPDPWAVTMPSLWKQYFEGDDQLRQRIGYALMQIFVVSLNNNTVGDAPCGAAAYADLMNLHAFGNVRNLLKDVTMNPIMGEYLSMKESAKADPLLGTQPDENYAREVMQLFSIGTVMLNNDGSVKLDASGNAIPTYTEDTVKDFAKALSGWTFAGQNQTQPWRWLYPDIWDSDPNIRTQKACAAWSSPMQPWTGAAYRSADDKRNITGQPHDSGPKTLLLYPGAPYSSLPANQSAQTDLDNLIDNVFNHPNVGPFLSRQLIQRLVTSNPTPQYQQQRQRRARRHEGGDTRDSAR
jgi:uncharacterized protein (DUF1800 family)